MFADDIVLVEYNWAGVKDLISGDQLLNEKDKELIEVKQEYI